MELTPIRVRGRRKRDRPLDDVGTPLATSRLRKVARFSHAGLRALQKPTAPIQRLSKFELLPTEIIQVIFEYSNNINLPLSSPVIASAVSAQSIYVRFTTHTLYAHERCEPPCPLATDISRLLQCRWMTWKVFQLAVQGCHDLAWKLATTPLNDDPSLDPRSTPPIPPSPNFTSPNHQPPLPYLHLHPSIQIPHSLLRGPWANQKLSFLSYLLHSTLRISWTSSSRGEVASSQGLPSAIAERNALAVACLVAPQVGVVPSTRDVRGAVTEHGCVPDVVVLLLGAVLRASIRSRGASSQGSGGGGGGGGAGHGAANADTFNFKDPSVWSWAGRLKRAGNKKGEWLVDCLGFCNDAASRNTVYDRALHDDFVRACGGRGLVEIRGSGTEVPLLLDGEEEEEEQ